MKELLQKLLSEESGQGMTEYALILALVSIAAIVALSPLGKKIKEIFENVTGSLDVSTE
ncbi:MAG TPA: Flp family type IVb pilin [Firmicutes bacterium]|jgi:pilus assembly protein Flp/PilA|nr:Flp family type IVb pilin [Bacillota bacterium]HAA38202.1 Flp family type IVb pilin [Bacillota bacterium]